MNEGLYKKLRDFAEGLLAAVLAGAVTAVVFSGADLPAKAVAYLAVSAGLTAGIAYTRATLGNTILPLLKEIATRPVDR